MLYVACERKNRTQSLAKYAAATSAQTKHWEPLWYQKSYCKWLFTLVMLLWAEMLSIQVFAPQSSFPLRGVEMPGLDLSTELMESEQRSELAQAQTLLQPSLLVKERSASEQSPVQTVKQQTLRLLFKGRNSRDANPEAKSRVRRQTVSNSCFELLGRYCRANNDNKNQGTYNPACTQDAPCGIHECMLICLNLESCTAYEYSTRDRQDRVTCEIFTEPVTHAKHVADSDAQDWCFKKAKQCSRVM